MTVLPHNLVNSFYLDTEFEAWVQLIADASGGTPIGAIAPGTANQIIQTNNAATLTVWSSTLGLGTAPLATSSIALGSTALTGTSQYGINNQIIASAAATAALYGSYTSVTTFAGSNTTTNVYGQYIANPTKGAGSTITNRYGLYLEAVSGGGTSNYGIWLTGASGTGAENLHIAGLGDYGINIVGTSTSTATSVRGIAIQPTYASTTTSTAYGVYVQMITQAAAFTMTNAYGMYIDTLSKGAASAVTNNYGLFVNTASGGASINYGVYIAGGTPGLYIAAGGAAIIGSNLTIGGAAAGTSAVNGISFGTTASTRPGASVDLVWIGGEDISAGHRALSFFTEEVPNTASAVASTHRIPMTYNGTQYAILVTTVLA